MSKLMRFGAARSICAGLFAFAFSQSQALAHVTLEKNEAVTGSYQVANFRIGHGCSGSPTINLRIEIPEGPESVRPQPKPGWTLGVEHAGERVTAINWKGNLPADQFDSFAVMMRLRQPGPLVFPARQTCERGEANWNEPPGVKGAHPAPVLTVTPAAEMAHAMPH